MRRRCSVKYYWLLYKPFTRSIQLIETKDFLNSGMDVNVTGSDSMPTVD
jgi:hypothetical protein